MKTLKYLSCLSAVISMVSCGNDHVVRDYDSPLKIQNSDYADIAVYALESPDTLLAFPCSYTVGVSLYKDNIIIKTVMEDSCITVFDRNTLEQKWKTGREGQGPTDVVTPDFFTFIKQDDDVFKMIDVNAGSYVCLDIDEKSITKEPLPDYIGFSSEVNMLKDYTVAAKNNSGYMFYIFDKENQKYTEVPHDIDCGEDLTDKVGHYINYMLSCKTYANQEQNRIITTHFFFDEYSVYDLSGNLLRKISLSDKNYDEKAAANRHLNKEYNIGFQSGFVTADALYVVRFYEPGADGGDESYQLIKMDWDGNPLKVYALDTSFIGKYYIDNDGMLYALTQSDDNEDEETYYLTKWTLN